MLARALLLAAVVLSAGCISPTLPPAESPRGAGSAPAEAAAPLDPCFLRNDAGECVMVRLPPCAEGAPADGCDPGRAGGFDRPPGCLGDDAFRVSPPADAPAGARVAVEVTHPEALGEPLLSLHFGPASVAEPHVDAYPHVTTGQTFGGCVARGAVVMPGGGSLYVRALLVDPSGQRWSPEARVNVTGPSPVSVRAALPARFEAGVPAPVTFHVEGPMPDGASRAAVVYNLHPDPRRTFEGPQAHGAGNDPFLLLYAIPGGFQDLPTSVSSTLLFPHPGRWHLRPGAAFDVGPGSGVFLRVPPPGASFPAGNEVWGDAIPVEVVPPAQPNIIQHSLEPSPACVEVLVQRRIAGEPPADACAGQPFGAAYRFNAPTGTRPSALRVAWSQADGGNGSAPITGWQAKEVPATAGEGGTFSANLNLPAGTYHLRGLAVVGDARHWSAQGTVVVAAPTPPDTAGAKFAHEHAGFRMFLRGEAVSFEDRAYDTLSTTSSRVHMHVNAADAGSVVHLEGNYPRGVPDVTLQEFFQVLGLEFRQGFLKLDSKGGHDGSAWSDAGADVWRVLVSKRSGGARGAFEPVPGDYSRYTMRDGDRVLLTYGQPTAAELAAQQAQVPEPPAPA